MAHALLGVGGPVGAAEFEEDGRVGNGEIGLDDEEAKDLGDLIEFGDDVVVQDGFLIGVLEQGVELRAELSDAGRVFFRDEVEFAIEIDVGSDVAAGADGVEDFARNFEMACTGDDGFDSRLGLGGIGGVRYDDPIAVAVEGEESVELAFPVGGGEARCIGHGVYLVLNHYEGRRKGTVPFQN